jgi:hypothetical protein
MKTVIAISATALLVTATANAAEFKSGFAVGDRLRSYRCVKTAGVEDGIKVGKKLCYT